MSEPSLRGKFVWICAALLAIQFVWETIRPFVPFIVIGLAIAVFIWVRQWRARRLLSDTEEDDATPPVGNGP